MVSTDVKWLQESHQWPGLTAIAKVDRIRETTTKTTRDGLLSARFGDAARALR
jgi:hypothetical protein